MFRLFTALLLVLPILSFSQTDSLSGFSISQTMIAAHQHGCQGMEAKNFIAKAKKDFVKAKYFSDLDIPTVSKFNPSTISNAPCIDEDFEALNTGTINSSAWVAQTSSNFSASSVPCATNAVIYANDNSQALIVSTPVTDAQCNNVGHSPLGGAKVLQLNRGNFNTVPTRVAQTFSVTSSNYIYQYAYKGVLNAAGQHSCCEQPALFFKFYDCSGNPITTMENSILSSSCSASADANYWTLNSAGIYHTPQWVMHSLDLTPYIGSCITVEVLVMGCIFGAHDGYVYYDARCSNVITPPVNFLYAGSATSGSVATCTQSIMLNAVRGVTPYLWNGPSTSGVNGSTLSSVTTSVSGTYSLTIGTGSTSQTQSLQVTIHPIPVLSIQGNSAVCLGGTVTLGLGGSVSTFTWDSGATTISRSVSPTVTTTYFATGTSSVGCTASAMKTITVNANPTLMMFSPQAYSVCPNSTVAFSAVSNLPGTILWNTGATSTMITFVPTSLTVNSATITTAAGCTATASRSVTVHHQAPVIITPTNAVGCQNSPITFTATAPGAVAYSWSGGSSTSNIYSFNASMPGIVFVQAMNSSGCTSTASVSFSVAVSPQVSISISHTPVCQGQPFTLTAHASTNVTSYMWTNGATTSVNTVQHIFNIQYGVDVTTSSGCTSNAVTQINLVPVVGQLQAYTNALINCPGQEVLLETNASNINSYLWSNGATTPSTNVYPFSTTVYTCTGIDANGCILVSTETVIVATCTGINAKTQEQFDFSVFPNPTTNDFTISSNQPCNGEIVNGLGEIVQKFDLSTDNHLQRRVSHLVTGLYFIKVQNKSTKLIVTH